MRKAFTKILQNDYETQEAEDGAAAWQALLDDDAIQLVISDIEMPVMDGYELLGKIRQSEISRVSEVPVIVITGGEEEQTRQRALDAGATDFVIKPIDRVQLLARARAQISMDQAHRDLAETTVALQQEATLDPLTQLASRRYFLQHGRQDIAYALRHQEQLSVIRLDVDRFKKYYAEYGDESVDTMLAWLAAKLAKSCRTEDTVARVSGAEFAVLAPKTDRKQAIILAQRILSAVAEKPFQANSVSIPITVSIGIATVGPDPEIEIEAVLALAETRLVSARRSGGNRIEAEQMRIDTTPSTHDTEVVVTAQEPLTDPQIVTVGEKETAQTAAAQTTPSAPHIEEALEKLARRETNELTPEILVALMLRLLPLIEHSNEVLDLGVGFVISALKQRLDALEN